MNQQNRLLNHLMSGKTITRFEAFISLDIQNLTARVADLRNAGVDVECNVKTDPKDRTYGEFYLPQAHIAYLKEEAEIADDESVIRYLGNDFVLRETFQQALREAA